MALFWLALHLQLTLSGDMLSVLSWTTEWLSGHLSTLKLQVSKFLNTSTHYV